MYWDCILSYLVDLSCAAQLEVVMLLFFVSECSSSTQSCDGRDTPWWGHARRTHATWLFPGQPVHKLILSVTVRNTLKLTYPQYLPISHFIINYQNVPSSSLQLCKMVSYEAVALHIYCFCLLFCSSLLGELVVNSHRRSVWLSLSSAVNRQAWPGHFP